MSTFIDFDTSGYNDSYTLRENLETSIQGNRVNITTYTGTTDTVNWKYNDFLSAQSDYIKYLNEYKSALSTANQQINTNIDNNAKKYSSEIANNIQYGGVNLIQGSASYKDWECYDDSGELYDSFYKENEGICKVLLRNRYEKVFLYTPKKLSLNIEQTYTLSFEMKASDTLGSVIIDVKNFLEEDNVIGIIDEVIYIPHDELSTEWKRYEYQFNMKENSIKGSVIFNLIKGNSDSTEFYLRKVKLQKGTIATEWSLAPEDVQNSISDFEDKLNEELGNTLIQISNLQAQIDGEVNSWFFEGKPTLNNTPANEWTTDELKQKHVDDTYTDISEYTTILDSSKWGEGYYDESNEEIIHDNYFLYLKEEINITDENRDSSIYFPKSNDEYVVYILSFHEFEHLNTEAFIIDMQSDYTLNFNNYDEGTYLRIHFRNLTSEINPSIVDNLNISIINPTAGQSWRWCKGNGDGDTTNTGYHWHKIANSDAVKALHEASKAQSTADGKSKTFITQPFNYSVGDLWILSTGTTINNKEYTKGTILTANESNETFDERDWSENVKYTDDTAAEAAAEAAETAKAAAEAAKEATVAAEKRINSWVADEKFSILEKPQLEIELTNINEDYNEITFNCEKYNLTSTTAYTTYYTNYTAYTGNLNTVISKLTGTTETTDIPSNFTDNSANYYSSRTEILKVISDTADAFAKAYVDDIKIGGVNLLYGSKNLIGRNGYDDFKFSNYNGSTAKKTIGVDRCYFEATGGTSQDKILITLLSTDDSRFDATKEYTFSVDITNTDYSTIVFYIKLTKTQGTTNWQKIVINLNETKHIEFTGYVEESIALQLYVGNYRGTTGCKFYLSNAQLEYGNKATSWKPNDADIIEAKENILKGGMMLDFNIDSSSHPNNGRSFFPKSDTTNYKEDGKYLLTSELKPNTEYVFSIEQIVLKKSSKIPDAISFCITNTGSNKATKYYHIPYVNKKLNYNFITPSVLNDGYYFRLYVGKQGSTDGVGLTYYGIKLAEGNKYTPWEGSADEQKTLMMLNNAMKGTTEIEGGLVMTNMIELKNSNGNVTAGISGLDTNKSFIENGTGGTFDSSLRFWAGSDLIGSNSAPFRVYNDGSVYGTNFYGFNSATVITSDNQKKYLTNSKIDLTKTGNIIYLDRSIINKVDVTGPDGTSTTEMQITLSTDLKFPDDVEKYIGSTVTIINPHQIPINECGNICNPDYVRLDYAFNNKQPDSGLTATTIYTGQTASGVYKSAVYVLKENDTEYPIEALRVTYAPCFTYFYYKGSGMCSTSYILDDGWKSNYAIQIYRLISTPYIRFKYDAQINGKLKTFGEEIKVNGVSYHKYAFWVLEDEKIPLPSLTM